MRLGLDLVQPTQRLDTLEVQHLQRVALSPHLFNNLVDASGCSTYDERPPLRPKSTTSVQLHDFLTTPFKFIKLLRGGRYLITWEGDSVEQLLQVWDIGVPGRRLLSQPREIGALRVNSSEFNMGDWAIDQEGDSVWLAIAMNRPARSVVDRPFSLTMIIDWDVLRVRVYEVKITEGVATFEFVATVGVPRDIFYLAIHRTRVLMHQIQLEHDMDDLAEWFTVWDYTTHGYTSWVVPRPPENIVGDFLAVSGRTASDSFYGIC